MLQKGIYNYKRIVQRWGEVMKVGIITSNASFLDNYGAVLQAYAMTAQLRKWNVEPQIINYQYNTGEQVVSAEYTVDRSVKARLKYILSGNVSLWQKVLYRCARGKRNLQTELFRQFVQDNIPIDLRKSVTYEELKKQNLRFEALICGSDQVWNPLIHANRNDPGFFLQFGNEKCRRIAYAPSFGVSVLPETAKSNLKEYTDSFDALSVREQSGAVLMKEICERDVPVMLDPTMMADRSIWDTFDRIPEGVPKQYILVYRFGRMEYMEKQIQNVAAELKLPILEIPVSIESYGKGSKILFGVGPEEFVTLIRNAEIVLTDSFHATVFSILNHTQFYTFLRQGKNEKNNMNSRMENLLEMLNLQERLIYPDSEIVSLSKVKYENADVLLEQRRNESQKFLKDALGE